MLLHFQPLHSPTYVYGFNPQKHIQGLHFSKLLSLHPGSILYSTHPLQSDKSFLLVLLVAHPALQNFSSFVFGIVPFLDNVFLVLFMKVLCPFAQVRTRT